MTGPPGRAIGRYLGRVIEIAREVLDFAVDHNLITAPLAFLTLVGVAVLILLSAPQ